MNDTFVKDQLKGNGDLVVQREFRTRPRSNSDTSSYSSLTLDSPFAPKHLTEKRRDPKLDERELTELFEPHPFAIHQEEDKESSDPSPKIIRTQSFKHHNRDKYNHTISNSSDNINEALSPHRHHHHHHHHHHHSKSKEKSSDKSSEKSSEKNGERKTQIK